MPIVTVRPNALETQGAWQLTGAATRQGAVSDDTDASYLTALSTAAELFGLGGHALAAGQRVARVRVRARADYTGSASAAVLRARYTVEGAPGSGALFDDHTLSMAWVEHTGAWRSELLAADPQQTTVDGLQVSIANPNWLGGEVDRAARVAELWVDLDVWERTAAPAVSAPSGVVGDTDTPEVAWTVAAVNDGTPSTWSRQVRVFRDDVYGAPGFDPATEPDVEWETLQSAQAGHDGTVTIGSPLANADTYRAYVRVGKEGVAGQTLWSTWGHSEWTQDLTPPDAPTLDVVVDQVAGLQRVTVTPAPATYDTVEQVEVQRSDDGGTTWGAVRDGLLVDVAGGVPSTLDDHDAPRDTPLLYRARTVEGISATSSTVTSNWTTSATVVHPLDGDWWVYDVDEWNRVRGRVRVRELPEFEVAQDVGVFRPPGRRTAVVVSGTVHGYDGSFELRATGVEEAAALDSLAEWAGTVLVKSPFGWQRYVRWTERSMVLAGTPAQPRHVWTVSYVEVDDGLGG